ncbi:MAG: DUF5106 domain-containing protein [Tannerella sp.]|nr:DUF5106 domain-containing protein [Tannerella sp.]
MKILLKRTFFKSLTVCALLITSVAAAFSQQPDPDVMAMMPEIPATLTKPEDRAKYLVMHYWDKFDFSELQPLMKDNLLERCFVDYLEVLSYVSAADKELSISGLLKKAEAKYLSFNKIMTFSEHYLYEYGSPIADEETFIPFLEYAVKSSALDENDKIRFRFLLRNTLNNRIGSVANDFTYTLLNEETGTLHGIGTDYTILFFKDPDCSECYKLTKQLIVSPVINNLLKQGKITILTIYEGNELDAWKAHASDVLNSWIYARDEDETINGTGIYDLKSFPTLYLLDKEKKVLLKDTTFEKTEEYLRRQQTNN